ncbi:MAG: branched-chain amino acid aminotransferase [Alphaproteobacteria bacterium]|nr:branched-chain amino acid aminotransferase [Alphaproteobacteria bacterium]
MAAPGLPFDDRDGWIWMDGKMWDWREAKVHVMSHGLHYGGSVFEGERIYDGQIFKLKEHSERLVRSGEMLDMPLPYTPEQIMEFSREVMDANKIDNGYVRPLAWRGPEAMGIAAQACKTHVAIAVWEWPKYFFPKSGDNAGLALKTSKWRRCDPRTMPVQAKCAGIYGIGTLAKHEADRAGYDDALMLDVHGRVAEASGANLFVVQDGKIKTPVPECFLNGITRQTVIKLARDLGYSVEETHMMPDDLKNVQEIFLTGTAAEIAPVSKIDEVVNLPIGPVTEHLKSAYSDLVRQKPAKAVA